MNRDLTVGKPSAVLWKFCLPLFGSILFQQMYNIADSFVAGKFIGEQALAAVGNSYEITLVFIAFGFGWNIGCSVVVSQLFGGKRIGELKTAVSTTLIACGGLCAVLMVIGGIFTSDLLSLINTPSDIFDDSRLYLQIYILSLPFVFYYNVSTGIFSALGDSRTPFLFLAASSTANIGMDILFVTAFGMKVEGVAWATFLCQGVSCILALVFMLRRVRRLGTQERAPVFSLRMLGRIAAIAVPSILQQSFVSVGNIIIQGIINAFGSSVIAGYSAAIKLNNLVVTSLSTLGNGISNYTAQNLGAGKLERVKSGFSAGLKMVWLICIPLVLLYFFAARVLVTLFLDDPTGRAMSEAVLFLRIVAPFYFAVAAKLAADGILRGAGVMSRFMISTFADLVLRVVLAWIFSAPLGTLGIWLAWPVGWLLAAALSLIFYRAGSWKRKFEPPEPENDGKSG